MKYIFALLLVFLLACQPEPVQEAKPVVPEPLPVVEPEPTAAEPEPAPVETPQPEVVAAPEPSPEPMAPVHKTVEVVIDSMKFSPETITLKVNDSILWKQEDDVAHTVTTAQAPSNFDSGILRQGQSFNQKFPLPGTYYIKCSLHTVMRQKVIVEP